MATNSCGPTAVIATSSAGLMRVAQHDCCAVAAVAARLPITTEACGLHRPSSVVLDDEQPMNRAKLVHDRANHGLVLPARQQIARDRCIK
jgi:hypothetical protein